MSQAFETQPWLIWIWQDFDFWINKYIKNNKYFKSYILMSFYFTNIIISHT